MPHRPLEGVGPLTTVAPTRHRHRSELLCVARPPSGPRNARLSSCSSLPPTESVPSWLRPDRAPPRCGSVPTRLPPPVVAPSRPGSAPLWLRPDPAPSRRSVPTRLRPVAPSRPGSAPSLRPDLSLRPRLTPPSPRFRPTEPAAAPGVTRPLRRAAASRRTSVAAQASILGRKPSRGAVVSLIRSAPRPCSAEQRRASPRHRGRHGERRPRLSGSNPRPHCADPRRAAPPSSRPDHQHSRRDPPRTATTKDCDGPQAIRGAYRQHVLASRPVNRPQAVKAAPQTGCSTSTVAQHPTTFPLPQRASSGLIRNS
jgi:hypothetical protein